MNSIVSIIIPIYKVEKYIKDTLESVVEQTYSDIELILVDDCGGDQSCDIAEKYLKETNTEYQLVRHPKNQGQAAARNTGTKIASGRWVYFLDSDDLILKNTIEILVNQAIEYDSKVVFSNFRYIRNAKEVKEPVSKCDSTVFFQDEILDKFLKREICLLAPGTLYEKTLMLDHELEFKQIPWSEDQHFLWRLLSYIDKAVYVNTPLYQYLLHVNSIMSATSIEKMIQGYKAISGLKKYYSKQKEIGKYIEPRWVLGTLNSASKIVKYKVWKNLKCEMNGSNNLKMLISFPDKKVKMLALIGLMCPRAYYEIAKNRKL